MLKVERWSPEEQNLPFATCQFSSATTDGETIMNEVSLLQSLGKFQRQKPAKCFAISYVVMSAI